MGYECAKNSFLSSADYHVLSGRGSLDKGHKAAAEISALLDLECTVEAVQIDVTDEDAVRKTVEQVTKDHQRLGILVNNAGMGENSTEGPPYQRLRDVLTTKAFGPIMVTDNFLDFLRKSSEPRLVLVGSSGGSLTQVAEPN